MPTKPQMAQLSRPFQVALGACVLFALLWFALLHRPASSSTASTGGSASAATHAPARSVGHTALRPVHAASRPAAPARHATSRPAVQAPHVVHTTVRTGSALRTGSARHTHPAATRVVKSDPVKPDPVKTTANTRAAAPAHAPAREAAPAMQATVAAELKQGKTVLLLFWNPHASDDVAVHAQVQAVAHKLGGRVAVHAALADQVGTFGSITRDIQLYQTPTLLIVNSQAQVTTLTGYTEAFAIEQAIAEARG